MSGYLTHDEAALRDAVAFAVERAGALGAAASASARHHGSGKIVVREGDVETAVRNIGQSLTVTVHRNGRSGSASTTAFDREAIIHVVEEAALIADRVQPDPDAALPPAEWLALDGPLPELYATGADDAAALLETAIAIDRAAGSATAPPGVALRVNEAAASASEGIWALATSAGLCRSSRFSNSRRWCAMLAQDADGNASDYDQASDRRPGAVDAPEQIAGRAAERTLRARGARPVGSRRCPVLFDARIAEALVDELADALSGMAQHRKASFLADPLDRAVAAAHLDLEEDPFEPFGLASGGFDSEGIAGSKRAIVEGGVARGLFLSTASARKLGMRSTGNADGIYNLRLTSRAPGGDRAEMLARLGTGLLVTGLQGGGTDRVTGNWTRAIKGFWVEGGAIVHAVDDVTLAGSLPKMLMGVVAVGDDVARTGAIRTGSILIDEMQLGGGA